MHKSTAMRSLRAVSLWLCIKVNVIETSISIYEHLRLLRYVDVVVNIINTWCILVSEVGSHCTI